MQTQRLHQEQRQEQVQEQVQQMRPLLQAEIRVLRMSQQEFEQDVRTQLNTNPALEEEGESGSDYSARETEGGDGPSATDIGDGLHTDGAEGDGASNEADTNDGPAPDSASQNDYDRADYERDSINDYQPDDIPSYYDPDDTREHVVADQTSFYDLLKEQAASADLTPLQSRIMDYLIGSLDDDGFLRKSAAVLCDEMEIYEDIRTTPAEVEKVIRVLQGFDPAGIGAHDLRESLIIQVRSRDDKSPLRPLVMDILQRGFDDYKNKHYDRLCQRFHIDKETLEKVYAYVRRLNPRPAGSADAGGDGGAAQVMPDFEVREHGDGFEVRLIDSHVPRIKVSSTYADFLKGAGASRSNSAEVQTVRRQVGEAQLYVAAVRQRQETMLATMKAIVKLQPDFFREGDRTLLRPMTQKDVADIIHRDPSTVSGVVSNKYAETPFGMVLLGSLFTQTFRNSEGEEVSREAVKERMRYLIKNEDPLHPLSDDELAAGLGIARRTVAKYRKLMHIPVARLRR